MNIIELVFNGFPAGYCPQDWDTLVEDAFSYTSVNFTTTGNVYYNWSTTSPTVDNRIYPWLRKLGMGVWDWDGTEGGWIKQHQYQLPLDAGVRLDFVGTAAELATFDGGNTNTLGNSEGPMWEIDTDFAGRIAMGPGTVGPDTLVVSTNLGAATVTLSNDQLKHTHPFGNYSPATGDNDDARFLIGTAQTFAPQNSMMVHGNTDDPQEANITSGNLITGPATVDTTATVVSVVPPVRGAYKIKRTARIYYKVLTV